MVHAEDSKEFRSLMISKIYFDIIQSNNNSFLRDRYLDDIDISKFASHDGENIYINTSKLNSLDNETIDSIYKSIPEIAVKAEIDSYSLSFCYTSMKNKEPEKFIFRFAPSNGWLATDIFIDNKDLPELFDDIISFCRSTHPFHGPKKSRLKFREMIDSKIQISQTSEYESPDDIPDIWKYSLKLREDGNLELIILVRCSLDSIRTAFDSVRNKYLDKFDIQYPITVDKLI